MKSTKEQRDSDPLPYRQVDRAVRPKAGLLAQRLGCTPQHALGSLLEWWDLCAPVRLLEQLRERGEAEVVLQKSEVERTFRLASGHDIDAEDLVTLGFLEKKGQCYRVRGLSRDFKPLARRRQARDAAKMGGQASARARKEASGTAQPRPGGGSGVASALAQPHAEPTTEPATEAPASTPGQANTEAPPNTADSGQRSSTKEEAAAPPSPAPDTLRRHIVRIHDAGKPPLDAEAFFSWAQDVRIDELRRPRQRPPHPRELGAWFSHAMAEVGGDVARLQAGWRAYLRDEHWVPKGCPWAGWVAQWEANVPPAGPPAPPPPTPERLAARELLGEYTASRLLADDELALDGKVLVVTTSDPFHANWLLDHHGGSGHLRVVERPEAQAKRAAWEAEESRFAAGGGA